MTCLVYLGYPVLQVSGQDPSMSSKFTLVFPNRNCFFSVCRSFRVLLYLFQLNICVENTTSTEVLESCDKQKRGNFYWGTQDQTLRTLRDPDQRLGGQDTKDISDRPGHQSTPESPQKYFRLVPYPQSQSKQTEDCQESVSFMGYLEDIEGS